ncbi:beta-galactosidase [Trifolium repens]|nr:beta-galactosidase [Trifolium repens]
MCERALVSTDAVVTSLGNFQQAYVYSTICTITYLLGPSASSRIVEMLFLTQLRNMEDLDSCIVGFIKLFVKVEA